MRPTLIKIASIIFFLFFLVVIFSNPSPVLADGEMCNCFGTVCKGIKTAIGCIPVSNEESTAAFFITWGVGIGGGLALILIAYGGFLVITSIGDPHRLQAGKELITGAVTGLILLVFSAFLLRILGGDILKIPGFK